MYPQKDYAQPLRRNVSEWSIAWMALFVAEAFKFAGHSVLRRPPAVLAQWRRPCFLCGEIQAMETHKVPSPGAALNRRQERCNRNGPGASPAIARLRASESSAFWTRLERRHDNIGNRFCARAESFTRLRCVQHDYFIVRLAMPLTRGCIPSRVGKKRRRLRETCQQHRRR